MTQYSEFFLKSGRNVIQYETLEISHPSFSQVYRIVRNAVDGLNVLLEGGTPATFIYRPVGITSLGNRDDLDSGFSIALGDLGTIIPKELDAVAAAGTFAIKPTAKYRAYRSDVLTAPMLGPLVLEVSAFSFNREGSSFEAKAPSLNNNRTGIIYDLDMFPMLRAFL